MNQADASQLSPANDQSVRGPVTLIYSPHAGSARHGHARELLERAGVSVALALPVSALDAVQPQGQHWRELGCVAVVAAGGDGTVGAVATHAASADLPLGILPLGTANDIARALDIPLAPDAAARIIAQGALRRIDAGQAVPSQTKPHASEQTTTPETATLDAATLDAALVDRTPEQAPSGAYFMHALTLGLNVEFARLATDVTRRKLWGKLTYAISALESLERLRPITVTLRFSGMVGAPEGDIFVAQSQTTLLTAINLPVFGGRMGLRVPGIRTDDRLLDYIVVEALEPRGARAAFETALGALTRAARTLWSQRDSGAAHPVQDPAGIALPGARWFRARAVEIETEQPMELTLDGELRGHTPAVARVAPRGVQMIVPSVQAPRKA